MFCFFFFKQKTAYELRISDWSSDVCSSDLPPADGGTEARVRREGRSAGPGLLGPPWLGFRRDGGKRLRQEHGAEGHDRSAAAGRRKRPDRKSVVKGKSVSVRVDLGGRRIITKKRT